MTICSTRFFEDFYLDAVGIRTSAEWPEVLENGGFMLAGIAEGDVGRAVATAVAMNKNDDNGIPVP